jgi:MFS family permease
MPRRETLQRETLDLNWAGKIAVIVPASLATLATSGILPVLPAISDAFADVPNAALVVRTLMSIVGVAMLIGAPVAGALADRFGRKRMMLTLLMTYGLVGMAGFFINNLYMLAVTRFIVGLCGAGVCTLALATIADAKSEDVRNRWIGYYNVFMGLGGLVVVPVAGLVGKLGWHWPFLMHVIALVVFVLVVMGFRRDAPRMQPGAAARHVKARIPIPAKFTAIAVAGGMLICTYLLFIPFHMRDIGLNDPALIGAALMPMSILTAATAFAYGAVRRHLSMSATFAVAFLLCAVAHAILAISSGYIMVVIGLGFMGVCSSLLASNIFALAAVTGPAEHRAYMMGLAKGGVMAGQFVGQMLMEPVMARSDASAVLMVLGAIAAALCLLYARLTMGAKAQQAPAE